MRVTNVNFKDDVAWANKPCFLKAYDNFYKSRAFKKKYLSKMYKSKVPDVVEIIRSDELLMQQDAGIDALIKLSNGTRLPVDEKTDKPRYINSPNIVLEIMSNPKYQTEGWGYHRGRYISYSCSNENEDGLSKEPILFFIDENFINTFNRNPKYKTTIISKKTNGLYSSLIKLIPRNHIFLYLDGKLKPPAKPKPKNKNLFDFLG